MALGLQEVLMQLVDTIASLKMNQLQLFIRLSAAGGTNGSMFQNSKRQENCFSSYFLTVKASNIFNRSSRQKMS